MTPPPDRDAVLASALRALEHAALFGFGAADLTPRIDRIVSDLVQQQAAQQAADDREARYEEAGHAVVAAVVGVPILAVHIGQDRDRGDRGHVLLRPPRLSPADVGRHVIIAMAGAAARSLFGCDAYASSGDVAEANRLTLWLGYDDRERLTFLDHCSARAQRLVRENAQWLEAVAEALRARPDLTRDDVLALKPGPVPDELTPVDVMAELSRRPGPVPDEATA